jgi:hypothetical protein
MFTISHAMVGPTGTRTQSVFAYNACVCVLKSKALNEAYYKVHFQKNNNRIACLLLSVGSLILEWFVSSVQCEKSKQCVRCT